MSGENCPREGVPWTIPSRHFPPGHLPPRIILPRKFPRPPNKIPPPPLGQFLRTTAQIRTTGQVRNNPVMLESS